MTKKFGKCVAKGPLLTFLLLIAILTFSSVFAEVGERQNKVAGPPDDNLTFLSIDIMPFGAMKDGKPVGFTVEILHEIMQRLGREYPLQFDQWKTVYHRALTEPNIVIWPPSRTPEREELFKWVGPLIPEKLVLFARKDSGLVINSLEDAKKVGGIATVAGYASEKILKQKGFENLKSQRSATQCPDALKFGRVDLWLHSNITMKQTALDANVDPDLFEPLFVVKEIPSYLAFSKTIPDEIVNSWQKTLDDMKKDGSWEKIVSNWIPRELLRIGSEIVELSEKERIWIKSHPTVKIIKSFHQPPFTINEANQQTGYLNDLLFEVLSIAGLKPEFAGGYSSYNDMVNALQNGSVDIMTNVNNIRQLSTDVVRTVPVVKTPYAVVAPVNAQEIKQTSDLFGKKVAVVKGYAQDQHLDKFPLIEKVHVQNNEEGFEAIRKGRAEFFLNNLANAGYVLNKKFATDLRVAGTLSYVDFPPLTLSFGVHGKDSPLPGIINKTLAAVPIHTLAELRNEWLPIEFTVKKTDKIALTPEEQAFVAAHPVIRVHNEQSWAPFNFYEKGSATGFSIDYMNLLAKKVGLQVEYISGPSWSEFISMIKGRELDVMLNIVKTAEREEFIRFTEKPYIETPRAIVVRKEVTNVHNLKNLYGKTVAVEKGFFYEKYLKKNHPEIHILTVKDTAETLRAVTNGDADATLGVIAVEQFLISKLFFSNLKLMVDPEEKALRSFDQFIGVRKDWPVLASILDKAMDAVTIEERMEISKRWIKQEEVIPKTVRLTPEEKAFLKDHPVLRVSNETDYPPFDFTTDGKPDGYSIDYLNLLAERLGIQFEYVNGYPWNELLSMFEKRELDIIHSAMKTEERLRYTLFTRPYLHQLHALVTLQENSNLKSLDDLKGKTLAMQKGFATNEFILPRYPDINILWVSGTLEGLKAVASGQADAVIDAQTVVSYLIKKHFLTNLTIANRIEFWHGDEQDFRVGVRSDWPLLKTILEKAMDSVTQVEETALRGKWFGLDQKVSKTVEVHLTKEEQKYLNTHPVLHVAFDVDWPPVEFSVKGNAMDGISADYLKRMSELLDVSFEPARSRSWSEMIKGVENGELDFFSAIAPTPQRRQWMEFTDSYLSFPIVIFTGEEVPYIASISDIGNKPVAVARGYASHDLLLENHPYLNLLVVENVKEGLLSVSTGKAFAFIGSLASASHIMSREGLTELKVSGETPYSYNIAMGTKKDNLVLLQILNKTLAAISSWERNAINSRWTSVTFEHKTDYSLIWQIGGTALIILVVILYWNRRLQIEVTERKRMEKAAESANKAKSEFLANMSHELRTPLNAILGFAQIMGRNPNISSEHENLKIIQRSGNHLLTLINQVLDLSKIEAGRITVEKSCFDLYHLLDELENMLSLKADKKLLSLSFDYSSEVPQYICSDEIKIRQVLINLLGNAIKFTNEGSVILRITTKQPSVDLETSVETDLEPTQDVHDDILLCFEIEDTGPGIASEEVENLFKAFGQTAAGREIQEGTGLGLVISHKFVQLLGGDIELASEVGKGSTFSFDIPVHVMNADDVKSEQPTTRVIAQEPGQPGYRMLIVDDMYHVRKLLFKFLTPLGFELREAADGKEAVAIFEEWEPHLVWMDMRMPVMDGFEATKKIRSLGLHSSQPVIIAVTASVFEDKQEDVIDAGCDDIVLKPFTEHDIVEMIKKYLNVKFIYSSNGISEEKAAIKPTRMKISPADLQSLPKVTLVKFKKAIATLEMDTALNVIEEIRKLNGPLAENLQQLVEEYRFDTLQRLLEHSEK